MYITDIKVDGKDVEFLSIYINSSTDYIYYIVDAFDKIERDAYIITLNGVDYGLKEAFEYLKSKLDVFGNICFQKSALSLYASTVLVLKPTPLDIKFRECINIMRTEDKWGNNGIFGSICDIFVSNQSSARGRLIDIMSNTPDSNSVLVRNDDEAWIVTIKDYELFNKLTAMHKFVTSA